MKKLRKILALVMAMAMVLGMSVTSLAATRDSATITVTVPVGETLGATFKYAQVIAPATSTEAWTGWDFASDEVAAAYLAAFEKGSDTTANRQAVIEELIAARNSTTGYAQTDKINKALSKVSATSSGVTFDNMLNPQSVTSAGVYAVTATETGYTYSVMAAYVGFGEVEVSGNTYVYPSLQDATLTAKRSPVSLTKDSADTDKLVAVGDTKEYRIKSYVPHVNPEAQTTDKAYHIYDLIKGASYDAATNFSVEGALPSGYTADTTVLSSIVVTVGGNPVDSTKVSASALTGNALTLTKAGVETVYEAGFDLDLSGYITDANTYAGQEVVVIYTTTVNATVVENKAFADTDRAGYENGPKYGEDDEKLYTGEIVLTKVDNENTSVKLQNAKFRVYKVVGEGSSATETYVGFTAVNGSEGTYTYNKNATAPTATDGPEVGTVSTNANGLITLQGLGAGTYRLKETVAPEGYHISAKDKVDDVTLNVTEGSVAEAVISEDLTVQNTKLSALPSTGGIGTTIFTIGGCAIMIIAAGLYFASRRRSAK